MTVAAGGIEADEFHRQQSVLIERWRAHIPSIEAVDMPGRHHFDVITAFAEPENPLCRAAVRRVLG
jgi:hypothetical protein